MSAAQTPAIAPWAADPRRSEGARTRLRLVGDEGRFSSLPDRRSTADAEALELFAAQQRSEGRSETTIRTRESILTYMARSVGKQLLEVSTHELRLHIGRPGIKESSRRTIRAAIVAFYTFAEDEGLRDDNPAAKLGKVKVPRPEPRPFSRQQIEAMLTSGSYRRTRAMILLGYFQGFRVSQIARVHGRDIDLAEGTIRTVAKGAKERVLPLHPVVAEIAHHMPADDYWFPARRGTAGPIRGRAVSDLIRVAKRRAGITDPTLTAHSLRHSFGTHLVEAGVNVRVIQELMLHEDLSSTQLYTGVSQDLKAAGIAMLSATPIPRQSGRIARVGS